MIKPERKVFEVRDIVPADYNPRKINKKQRDGLKRSLDRFGYLQDIIVNTRDGKNIIVGGHKRLEAMGLQPGEEIECTIVDLSAIEEKALNVALNNRHTSGEYDQDGLEKILQELKSDWSGFDDLNFDDLADEFKFDLAVGKGDGGGEDNLPPEPEKVVIKLGDLIELGNHRLLCGSSTNKEDVEFLMNDIYPDLIHTDPPYGMNAVSKSGVLSKNYDGDILGDDNPDIAKESFKLINGMYPKSKQIWWGANYYCSVLPDSECWLVWDKNNGGSDQTDCELAWANFRSVVRQFTQASEKIDRLHPTQKPVSLMEWILKRFKFNSNTVADYFGGSGSTLIAAEKHNKNSFIMELDEKYCQVIIQRWVDYTEKDTIKINGNTISWNEYKNG